MNQALFQPFAGKKLKLKNRIVMAPMTRARAGVERIPNALMAEYYGQRADAGLIIIEATVISEQGIGWNNSPGIYTDEMTEGWKLVTKKLHDVGTPVYLPTLILFPVFKMTGR